MPGPEMTIRNRGPFEAPRLPTPEPHEGNHGLEIAHTAYEVGHVLHMFADGLHLGTGAVETVGLHAMAGAGVSALGLGLAVGVSAAQILYSVAQAGPSNIVSSLVNHALGSESIGSRFGMVAAMTGLSPQETRALRDSLPASQRDEFDYAQSVAARERVHSGGRYWNEACGLVKQALHSYADGFAAAIEGWDRDTDDPAFIEGRARALEMLERCSPAERDQILAAARQDKEQGYQDARSGHVDRQQFEQNAHYRSGVSHEQRHRSH